MEHFKTLIKLEFVIKKLPTGGKSQGNKEWTARATMADNNDACTLTVTLLHGGLVSSRQVTSKPI
jgi:hypothetical protein